MPNQFTDGWSENELNRLKEYVSQGLNNKEIAQKLGRSCRSIAVKKNRLGLTNKKPEYATFNNREWLYQKYVVEGYSTTDIAAMLGVHFGTVAKWLKKHNIEARGFYEKSERHKKKIGEKLKERNFEKHHSWKGGKTYTNEGYVYVKVKDHPYANANNCVLEHRLVMERFLGRFLEPYEVVHHLNEKKDDNRIENLFLFYSSKDHSHFHVMRKKNPNFPMLYKYDYLHKEDEAI